jgi:hypothetical protein
MCARALDFDTVSKLFSVIFCYYVDTVILFFHFILLFSDVWGHICPREKQLNVTYQTLKNVFFYDKIKKLTHIFFSLYQEMSNIPHEMHSSF